MLLWKEELLKCSAISPGDFSLQMVAVKHWAPLTLWVVVYMSHRLCSERLSPGLGLSGGSQKGWADGHTLWGAWAAWRVLLREAASIVSASCWPLLTSGKTWAMWEAQGSGMWGWEAGNTCRWAVRLLTWDLLHWGKSTEHSFVPLQNEGF